MSLKYILRVLMAAIVISLLLSSCTQAPSSNDAIEHVQTQPSTTPAPSGNDALSLIQTQPSTTPAPQNNSSAACGVAVLNQTVGLWAEGERAQELCTRLITAIRQVGDQPVSWNGQIGANADSFEAVCSDSSATLSYEVIDTGSHINGSSLCQWVVSTYGASGLITDPDLFNIVRPAQQVQDATLNAAQQSQAATLNAPLTAFPATEQSQKVQYAAACEFHNGYIDTNGFGDCRVDYPGAPSQEIPLNPDGSWNATMAETVRESCNLIMEAATAAALAGQPMSIPPQYHADTGVCVEGH